MISVVESSDRLRPFTYNDEYTILPDEYAILPNEDTIVDLKNTIPI